MWSCQSPDFLLEVDETLLTSRQSLSPCHPPHAHLLSFLKILFICGGERQREQQTLHWVWNPTWGSIPEPWGHDLRLNEELGKLLAEPPIGGHHLRISMMKLLYCVNLNPQRTNMTVFNFFHSKSWRESPQGIKQKAYLFPWTLSTSFDLGVAFLACKLRDNSTGMTVKLSASRRALRNSLLREVIALLSR